MNKKEFTDHLNHKLKQISINFSNRMIEALWSYLNFLIEENRKYNLTAITEPEDIINKHFIDSLIIDKHINIGEENKIIDVGTGAGFPGMVLKIYKPDIKLLLLDSLKKRVKFLRMLTNKLSLNNNLEIIHERAESLGKNKEFREKFDLVVSRAVAPINVLSEYTIPFASPSGKIVYYKGPDYREELKKAEKALEILGGKIIEIKEVKIKSIKGERYLIIVEKNKNTPDKYPRRPGMPKKRPL